MNNNIIAVIIFCLAGVGAVKYLEGAVFDHYDEPVDHQPLVQSPPSNKIKNQTASKYADIVYLDANRRGQFDVDARINGRQVEMLADTGATVIALTHEDARAAGISVHRLDYKHPVSTANGRSMTAYTKLDRVEVEGILVRDVDALILQPGASNVSLLGMSFISRLKKFEVSGNQLILYE